MPRRRSTQLLRNTTQHPSAGDATPVTPLKGGGGDRLRHRETRKQANRELLREWFVLKGIIDRIGDS